MNNEKNDQLLTAIKKSIDVLVLIELCKAGVTRNQARELLGTLGNNTFSKFNSIFNTGEKKDEKRSK